MFFKRIFFLFGRMERKENLLLRGCVFGHLQHSRRVFHLLWLNAGVLNSATVYNIFLAPGFTTVPFL